MSGQNSPKNDDIQPSNEGFEQKMNDFGKLYKDFCIFLHKTIETEYEHSLVDMKSLYYFGKFLLPHMHEIAKCNDEYCNSVNFKLFGDITFTTIWEKVEKKADLWKFFHSMYVLAMGTNVLPSMLSVKLSKQLTDEELEQSQANIDNYAGIIQEIINFRDSNSSNNEESGENTPFGANFLENSSIGQLAKENSSEIDTTQFENIENPAELMSQLFSGGGENGGLMNLMQTVTQKLTTKMESGEIDTGKLMEEAQGMLGGLTGGGVGCGDGMPDLSKLMGGLGGMGGLAQMANLFGGGGGFTNPQTGKAVKSRKIKRRLKKKSKSKNKKKK